MTPGIWIRWSHERPPEYIEVEGAWTDSPSDETNITKGVSCRRGCCFFALGDNLVEPTWWRLPLTVNPQS